MISAQTDAPNHVNSSSTLTSVIIDCKSNKDKGFPYLLPSVGPGADPSIQAVSPQVTTSSSSSSSRRQICKARLHTNVSQTRLLLYAHSNSQLFRLRLNCSRVPALRMFDERPFQVEGPSNAEAAAAEASCQCTGDNKVAVISRPQS